LLWQRRRRPFSTALILKDEIKVAERVGKSANHTKCLLFCGF
jgi:hypothetical protein